MVSKVERGAIMRIHSLFLVGLLVLAQPAAAFVQQSDAADVLKEVRLLRQAIESIIATNIRVQIVSGRLQIQEQRTVRATEQLDLARQRRIEIVEMIANFEEEMKRQADAEKNPQNPEHTEILAAMRQSSERELAHMHQSRARAIAEEAEAANVMAQEQSQWSDLNQQLEGLERSLRPTLRDR
jgi:hypothetical protein